MKNVFVMSFVDDLETVNKFDEFGFVCESDDSVNGIWCCERDLSYLSEEEVINFIEKTSKELDYFVNVNGENFDKEDIELIKNKLN